MKALNKHYFAEPQAGETLVSPRKVKTGTTSGKTPGNCHQRGI